jgi:hypothetical protein
MNLAFVSERPTYVGVVWEGRLRISRLSVDPLRESVSRPPALLVNGCHVEEPAFACDRVVVCVY